MPHSLILGITESGKTTLAKRLAALYKQKGIGVIVLDPIGDPGWNSDFVTADEKEFLSVFWSSRKCAVFIDESGEFIGQYDKAMKKTVTKGRHWGHNVHLLAQGATQVAKIARDQCTQLFLFTSPFNDTKILSQEFNKAELIEASSFPAGTYFYTSRFGAIEKRKVF